MYKKKAPTKMIKANCGASVKAHGKMKRAAMQSGGMIGKIKKNEVFGTEEKRQEDMDRYMSGTKGSRLAYNKGGAVKQIGDTPEEEDMRAARRNSNNNNNTKTRSNGSGKGSNGRQ